MYVNQKLTIFENISTFFITNKNKILYLVLILLFSIFFRLYFIIFLFFFLDFLVSYVDQKYKIDLMFDFNPLAVILFSYLLTPMYGLFIALSMPISRIFLGKLEKRHLIKLPILVTLAYLANFFNFLDIVILGPLLFLVRYLIEYLLEFAVFGKIDGSRTIRRVGHFAASFIFFTIFSDRIISFIF